MDRGASHLRISTGPAHTGGLISPVAFSQREGQMKGHRECLVARFALSTVTTQSQSGGEG